MQISGHWVLYHLSPFGCRSVWCQEYGVSFLEREAMPSAQYVLIEEVKGQGRQKDGTQPQLNTTRLATSA